MPSKKPGALTMGEKLQQKEPDDIPGPGNYEIKSERGKGMKIGQRIKEPKKAYVPGPYWGHENWAPGFGYEVDYEVEFVPDDEGVWHYNE